MGFHSGLAPTRLVLFCFFPTIAFYFNSALYPQALILQKSWLITIGLLEINVWTWLTVHITDQNLISYLTGCFFFILFLCYSAEYHAQEIMFIGSVDS